MDELVVAEVDAAVGGAGLVGGEEDEVAGLELALARRAQAEAVLVVGETRDADAVLAEDILQVARAVKGLWRRAAEAVGHADVRLGCRDDAADLAALEDRLVVGHGRAVVRRRALQALEQGFLILD